MFPTLDNPLSEAKAQQGPQRSTGQLGLLWHVATGIGHFPGAWLTDPGSGAGIGLTSLETSLLSS